jgi:hypothetical protein
MDLTNNNNWSLIFSQSLRAKLKAQYGEGSGSVLIFDPIEPVFTTLATPVGLVKATSTTAHPRWYVGCWLNAFLALNGQRTKVFSQKCPLSSAAFIHLPSYGITPYEIEFSIPHWMEDLNIQLWQFTDQSGRYLPANDQVLLSTMDVVARLEAELDKKITQIVQQTIRS